MKSKFVLGVCVAVAVAACAALGPAERSEITDVAAQIAACQKMGRSCQADGGTNCYDVYDRCMKEAGLH